MVVVHVNGDHVCLHRMPDESPPDNFLTEKPMSRHRQPLLERLRSESAMERPRQKWS